MMQTRNRLSRLSLVLVLLLTQTLFLSTGTVLGSGNDENNESVFLVQTSSNPNLYESLRNAIQKWLGNDVETQSAPRAAIEEIPGGLNYELYQITTPRRIPVMPSNVAELVKEGISTKIDLTESTLSDYMAMRFEGFITTPSNGSYTFALYSDEGSKMRIDDQLVVNNDGVHTAKNKASSPITLSKGDHTIKVEYFELVGSQTLKAYRKGPDFATQEIPSSALRPKTTTGPTTCILSANAGPDKTITLPTNTVTLVGSGPCATNYNWSKISGPAGETIVSHMSATVNVTNLVAGTYVFRLNAIDAEGYVQSDTVQVVVNPATINTTNVRPTSDAGADKTITLPTSTVTVNGIAADNDGTITANTRRQVSGPTKANITSFTSPTTTITNLSVAGTYVFWFNVTDNKEAGASDEIQITVRAADAGTANIAPVVNAGVDKVITLPTNSVAVLGTANDSDGTITNVTWTKTSGPTSFAFSNANAASTNITNLVAGTYVFRLTATDNNGAVSYDEAQVIVNPATIGTANIAPIVNAGIDKTITLPVNSTAVMATVSDPDGTVANVTRTKVSGPASFTFSNINAAATNITNLVAGTYVFRLTATDNNGAASYDEVQVVVNPANIAPVVNAGADKTITLPTNSVTVLGTANDSDGTIASVTWTKVSGPTSFSFSNVNAASTNINNLSAGTYVFRLTAIDNNGATSYDEVQVVVNPAIIGTSNIAPTVNAGTDKVITLPTNSVSVAGVATDSDGTISSIKRTKLSGPTSFTIQNDTALSTTINNLTMAGTYVFRLTVTDNDGASSTDDVQVIVNPMIYTPVATATHYASPVGGGDGKSANSPFTIADFWKIAKPGDILGLVDGVYQGANSMIDPPSGLSGLPGQPITIRALNDGKVEIDGQHLYQPIALESNDRFVIEGMNAHSAGGDSYSVGVVVIKNSDNVRVSRVVGWNARGDSNIFRNWGGSNVEFVDTVGFGTARKIYSTSQGSNGTKFTRTFGSWDNNINIGPKETYSLSYNSRNTTCENCIAARYGQQMPQSYEARETNGSLTNQFFTNYTVQAPQGLFSADGFDVTPDVANIKILGSIAYLKADNSFHNVSTRNRAGPFSLGLKGITIDNSIAYIEPGSNHSNIRTMNLENVGSSTLNKVKNSTMIGGDRTHIGSDWQPQNMYSTANCDLANNGASIVDPKAGTAGGARIMYRYENGVLTNKPLWPWPMNQRAIDAMTRAGFQPIDITRTIFGLCNGTLPAEIEAQLNGTAPANQLPTVNAGADKTITLPSNSVNLAGIATDSDGMVTNTTRSKVSGPSIYTLGNANEVATMLTNLIAGTYVFRLTATDNSGATSYDDIQIIVNPQQSTNIIPTVNAGSDKILTLPTNSVTLIGTATDSDGVINTINWSKISGPTSITIASASTINTAIGNLVQGNYVLRLSVTDNNGATSTDDVQIVVNAAVNTGGTGLADTVTLAKQWLTATPTQRAALEPALLAVDNNTTINQIISQTQPNVFTETAVGEVFYQNFKRPDLKAKYPAQIYHMYVPTDYTPTKKKKLLLWFHGGGSCDSMASEASHLALFDMDNEKVTGRSYMRTETDDSDYILVSAVAPCGSLLPHPQHASRRDVPIIIPYIQDLITDVSERYNIDYNNIGIAGFSMGGIGAGYIALALNDRWSAAMPSARSRNIAPRRALTDLPVYIIQGKTDAYFNSTSDCRPHRTAREYSKIAYDALSEKAPIHVLNTYPGGHGRDGVGEAAGRNFLDGKQGWITDKVRNPYRTHVNAVSWWTSYTQGSNFNVDRTAPKTPKTLWITITQEGSGTIAYDYARKEGDGMCTSQAAWNNWSLHRDTIQVPAGHVEANILGNNQINVTTRNVKKFNVWADTRMGLDLSQPITIIVNGTSIQRTCTPSLLTALKSYEASKDRGMIYNCLIENIVVPGA